MFENIEYLKKGNDKQRKSYDILNEIEIFEVLKKYDPILVGTIPIGIDVAKSDLDIVCYSKNLVEIEKIIIEKYSDYKKFSINREKILENILVINFFQRDVEIEIYISNIPSKKTNGYRHMTVENRFLKLSNEKLKENIISLKKSGIKTEPAFSRLLNILGNPYEKLLEFENCEDKEIEKLLEKIGYKK